MTGGCCLPPKSGLRVRWWRSLGSSRGQWRFGRGWFSSQVDPPVPRGPVSQLAHGLLIEIALPGFTGCSNQRPAGSDRKGWSSWGEVGSAAAGDRPCQGVVGSPWLSSGFWLRAGPSREVGY